LAHDSSLQALATLHHGFAQVLFGRGVGQAEKRRKAETADRQRAPIAMISMR
jgi:hypothetical protein